jgi:curved DNA-binding protein CbpA
MPIHDPYETLQVHPKADSAAIDAAYARLLNQYAPERLEGAAPELRDLAERKCRELDEAYALLSDPARRAVYDAQTTDHRPPTTDHRPQDEGDASLTRDGGGLSSVVLGPVETLDYRPLPPAGRAERPRGFDDQPKQAAASRATPPMPAGFAALVVAAVVLLPALIAGLALTGGGSTPPPVATATPSPADQFEALILQARTFTEQNPDDARAWIDYGNLLYDSVQIVREQAPDSVLYEQRLPRWLDAITAYERALQLDPSNAAVLADKGASACFYGSGTGEEPYLQQGLADTTLALEQAPEEPRALLSHGYCLVSARPPQTEAAIAGWRKILDIVPADSPLAGQAAQLISQYSQQ